MPEAPPVTMATAPSKVRSELVGFMGTALLDGTRDVTAGFGTVPLTGRSPAWLAGLDPQVFARLSQRLAWRNPGQAFARNHQEVRRSLVFAIARVNRILPGIREASVVSAYRQELARSDPTRRRAFRGCLW